MCGQRGRNMTVIVAISDQVGVAYYIQGEWGGFTAGVFRELLTSVLGDELATVVMDNAPAHRGAGLADRRQRPASSPQVGATLAISEPN